MTEPDDFGLSPLQTLAHVADQTRSPKHGAFWKTWAAAVWASQPRLLARREDDPSDPSATHEFESIRSVRIGCRLLWPDAPAHPLRAGLVVLHGYSNIPHLAEQAEGFAELRERGIATLLIRVRGYAGSQLDTPDLVRYCGAGGGGGGGGAWITYGLHEPISERGLGCAWSFSCAVADTVNACRALRRELAGKHRDGGALPIAICGESFGGALAILAASQLAEMDEPGRLAIGLPSMGGWRWRMSLPERSALGAGGIIRRFIADHPRHEAEVLDLLLCHDAAIHAGRVRCPVLCKLACMDDVVPAPSAAAAFNNLATPPGLKHRFVARYGHFDGGIADMRRHAMFERLVREFVDPDTDPAAPLETATLRPSAPSAPQRLDISIP
jgi:cephalosporin-C deacetylase-like acetyl esterase